MRNYLPNDEESRHYACLLQWDNIYYQAADRGVHPAQNHGARRHRTVANAQLQDP